MIEMGKKYQTRDGRAVRILCVDAKRVFSVIGLIANLDGSERMYAWEANGGAGEGLVGQSDLIPVPTKHEMWVLITDNNPHRDIGPERYPTLAEATAWCNKGKGEAVAHVTWEGPCWNEGK